MSDARSPCSEFILYQTEGGRTRVQCLFEEDIRNFRIADSDGHSYATQHYSLEVIIAVGYRVKSLRGTHSHQWATVRLNKEPCKYGVELHNCKDDFPSAPTPSDIGAHFFRPPVGCRELSAA